MRVFALTILASLGAYLGAEEFVHQDFRFTVPSGFTVSPEAQAATNAICAYQSSADDPNHRTLLMFEALPFAVPDRVDDPSIILVSDPEIELGERWVMDWQDTSIGVVEGLLRGRGSHNHLGQPTNSYDFVAIGYLPIRPTSIRVGIVGNPSDIHSLRATLRAVIGSVHPTASTTEGPDAQNDETGNSLTLLLIFSLMGLALAGGIVFILKRPGPSKTLSTTSIRPLTPSQPPGFDPPTATSDSNRPPWEQ